MDNLEKRIMQADLTKTQSLIAKKLLQNEAHLCFVTLADLSKELSASDASIIRTARALGYSGFNEMQKIIREELSQKVRYASNSILTPAEKLVSNIDILERGDIAKEFLQSAFKNLEVTFSNNNIEKIDALSDIIIKSRKKYFVGLRGSSSIVNILSISVAHLLPNVIKLDAADFAILESAQDLGPSDCVFIVNFPRYPKIIDVIHDIAKKAGAKVILMTESPASPKAKEADILISASVDSISFFNSYIAPLFLAELISAEIAKKLGKKSEARMKELDSYVAESGLY